MALTQRFFAGATCQHEDHDPDTCAGGELYLHPRCHMGSPTWAVYREGRILVTCAECTKLVAEIDVAPGSPENGVTVTLAQEEAESLAFPITLPTEATVALAEAGRGKIARKLRERYIEMEGEG